MISFGFNLVIDPNPIEKFGPRHMVAWDRIIMSRATCGGPSHG